jgi:chromosome segregation ATPase
MEQSVQAAIQLFLDQIQLNTTALVESQATLQQQFSRCKSEIENQAAISGIPADKFAIIDQRAEKIPKLQERINNASKKLLDAHKAILQLRREVEQLQP